MYLQIIDKKCLQFHPYYKIQKFVRHIPVVPDAVQPIFDIDNFQYLTYISTNDTSSATVRYCNG